MPLGVTDHPPGLLIDAAPDARPFVTAAAVNAVVAICVVLVPLAAVGAAGVPVSVGLALNTTLPEPVEVVTPVPPFATAMVVAFQVPEVSVPTPVMPVYDPDTLADGNVPLATLEAFSPDNPDPSPATLAKVPTFAANDPLESRRTIVLAPLEELPVVRAFAIVPAEIFEALIEVIVKPPPTKLVADTLPVALTLPVAVTLAVEILRAATLPV